MPRRERPEGCCPVRSVRPLSAGRLDDLSAVFRALSDPNRLEMLRLICAQRGPICVCDVNERFDLSQPTISHHLRVLREAGLVRASRAGIWSFYAPEPAGLALLERAPELLGTPAAGAA